MKIFPEKLSAQLNQSILPAYLVAGDEPLLRQEACDTIRKHTKDHGFNEREVHHIESANFDWQGLLTSANSLSLFSEKKVLDIRLNKGKPNDKALLSYFDSPNPDTVILITSTKIDASSQKTKWFKALERHIGFVPIWPLDSKQFPQWLNQRLSKKGLDTDPEALQFLANQVEGNLLAATQEIEKLSMLYGKQRLTLEDISQAVSSSARYNLFDYLDTVFQGQALVALRMLRGLKSDGVVIPVILANLSREIRQLHGAAIAIEDGQNPSWALKQQGVWEKRHPTMKSALNRLTSTSLSQTLQQCAKIDQMLKGLNTGDVWREMELLNLALCER